MIVTKLLKHYDSNLYIEEQVEVRLSTIKQMPFLIALDSPLLWPADGGFEKKMILETSTSTCTSIWRSGPLVILGL